MSDKSNERIEDRLPYRAAVWLQPNQGQSLVGETRNVSRGGMFVNVVPTPTLGQEVLCELPGYRAVRGRVVWISAPEELEEHGVGIEFVDLSPKAEQATPILATPSPTYAGLELHGPLDFLAAGAEVQVHSPSGHRQLHARIANVELDKTRDSTLLTLSLIVAGDAELDENWFPEITFEPAPPMSFASPPVLPPMLEPLLEIDEALMAPRNAEPTAAAVVFEAYTHDKTERTLVAEPTPLPSRSPLMPLAVVAGVVLMALVVLRVGFPTNDTHEPLTVVVQPAPAQPAASQQVAPQAPEPVAAQPEAPAAEVAAPVAAAPVAVATPAKAPSEWTPEVTEVGGEPTVIVPIAGSAQGMSHFVLDKPQGVAVDLPNAHPAVTAKPYLLHHPLFHSLWVRQMEKGLQVRLHVEKGVKLAVDIVDGSLRIRRKE